jgi:multidrug efflux pump subunit AcrB
MGTFPYTFSVLAALIVFLGVSAFTVVPMDIFPQLNIPVIWQYTGLTTPETEQRVTTYLATLFFVPTVFGVQHR